MIFLINLLKTIWVASVFERASISSITMRRCGLRFRRVWSCLTITSVISDPIAMLGDSCVVPSSSVILSLEGEPNTALPLLEYALAYDYLSILIGFECLLHSKSIRCSRSWLRQVANCIGFSYLIPLYFSTKIESLTPPTDESISPK